MTPSNVRDVGDSAHRRRDGPANVDLNVKALKFNAVRSKRDAASTFSILLDPRGWFPTNATRETPRTAALEKPEGRDETLVDVELQPCVPIAKEQNKLTSINAPRKLHPTNTGGERVQLVAFPVAFTAAYGAVLYPKTTVSKITEVYLLVGKARVEPAKPITLPREELLAALVASRLIRFIGKHMDVETSMSIAYGKHFALWRTLAAFQYIRGPKADAHQISLYQRSNNGGPSVFATSAQAEH